MSTFIAVVLALTLALVTVADPMLASPPRCDAGKIESKADRFAGTTTLTTPYCVNCALATQSPQLVLISDGSNPGSVQLAVRKVTTKEGQVDLGAYIWQYKNNCRIQFLADGKPFTLSAPEFQWEGRLINGPTTVNVWRGTVRMTVLEAIRTVIPIAELGQLLSASKIEYKVCNDERELNAGEICSARALYWAAVTNVK